MLTIQIESFNNEQAELLKEAFKIRNTVFVEEQGVDKFLEYDGLDNQAIHYLVLHNGKPVCTARWRETEKGIKLERFAVLKEYRGKSLGSVMLRYILEEVIPSKKKIYLHAQISAVNFYKAHGFETEGEKFTEAEIEHYTMVYPKK
jgi:predicted GNAT family N-acyltransferase